MEDHVYPEEYKQSMWERVVKLSEIQVLPEVRCKKCNGLLFKGEYSTIEIKCHKCGYLNKI